MVNTPIKSSSPSESRLNQSIVLFTLSIVLLFAGGAYTLFTREVDSINTSIHDELTSIKDDIKQIRNQQLEMYKTMLEFMLKSGTGNRVNANPSGK